MKNRPKLSRYFTVALGLLTMIMIIAYSVLVVFSVFSGLEDMATFGSHLTARDFELEYRKNSQTPLPETKYAKGYLGEKNLPQWVKARHTVSRMPHGTAIIEEMPDLGNEHAQSFTYQIFSYDLYDGKRLYLVETYLEKDEVAGMFKKSDRMASLILVMGIGFIILIFLTLFFLFKSVSDPVEELLQWAGGLTRDNLESEHPDFKFQEINHLADLIRDAISDLNKALKREHEFLRNASHELRTPIAVLKTNNDLLKRLRSNPDKSEKACQVRIQRAVDNMQSLTETLLWLSRKEESMPEPEPVLIHAMVEELVEENRYLLEGKSVALDLSTMPVECNLPVVVLKIALSNLIRNAFQYTHQGQVSIAVTKKMVSVMNQNEASRVIEVADREVGFGLGLTLVDQICDKLGLSYSQEIKNNGYRSTLFF